MTGLQQVSDIWNQFDHDGTATFPCQHEELAEQSQSCKAAAEKQHKEEQEERLQADAAPGAAHGRGQFQRRQLLAQAAAVAVVEVARQKEAEEAQLLLD
eukprot:3806071-Rhodomonas_salina.1